MVTDPTLILLLLTSSTTIQPTLASSSWATLLAFLPSATPIPRRLSSQRCLRDCPGGMEQVQAERELDVRQKGDIRLIPLVMTARTRTRPLGSWEAPTRPRATQCKVPEQCESVVTEATPVLHHKRNERVTCRSDWRDFVVVVEFPLFRHQIHAVEFSFYCFVVRFRFAQCNKRHRYQSLLLQIPTSTSTLLLLH